MPVQDEVAQTATSTTEKRGGGSLFRDLVSFWPSLPFMSLGLWGAWSALAYSGSLWLSENETNGEWLSNLLIVSSLSFAVVFLVAALAAQRGRLFGSNRQAAVGGGVIAAIGCLGIILIGPYYLGTVLYNLTPVFYLSAIVSGVGMGMVGLRCGVLYGTLPPRRALLYVALSQLVCAFVYFIALACPDWAPVEHGPSLAGILFFCLLPVAAGVFAAIETDDIVEGESEVLAFESGLRNMPTTFFKFIGFVFVMSLLVSIIRSAVVTTHALASTLEGNNVIMLARVVFGLALIIYGVRPSTHGYTLGKLCSLIAVFAGLSIAALAAFGGLNNAWSVAIYTAASVFEALMWAVLAFIVAQKRLNPVVVFGLGRGFYMLACGIGWLIGVAVPPAALTGATSTVVYIVMAGVMLLLALGLFSERDFERLFSPVKEGELSLPDLFDMEAREAQAEQDKEDRGEKRGRFSRAIEKMTEAYGLSARESEVLRCLAMGYGSERMAETLGIKVNTARAHTHNVYVKLEVHSREDLMLLVDDEVAAL